MDRETALQLVKSQLPDHRYQHTLGVMETAITLANRFGANPKQAELAAIFHDYAKFRSKEEMKQIIIDQRMDPLLLEFNSELWHAPVGAYLVKMEAGINDVEVLAAIRYHTSGRPEMNVLEKVIYLADYIEPGRHFPGVEEVREIAKVNLTRALILAIKNTIVFLLKKNQPVFPETFVTYNQLIKSEEN